jgi:hypothetical protein
LLVVAQAARHLVVTSTSLAAAAGSAALGLWIPEELPVP